MAEPGREEARRAYSIYLGISVKGFLWKCIFGTINFFQENIPRLAPHQLVNLKVKDIADGNLFLKRLDDIATPLSILTYMRLQTAFHVLRNKMRNRLAPNRVQLSLTAFLKSFKKGS